MALYWGTEIHWIAFKRQKQSRNEKINSYKLKEIAYKMNILYFKCDTDKVKSSQYRSHSYLRL